MRTRPLMALALLAAAIPASAFADVKHGIDLWNAGDYRTAIDEWRPAAIAGDPQAQFNLAQAYKLGRGVQTDMSLAESWYRKAAVQGLPQAEVNYGLALFDRGDRDAALPWLEKAVACGEPRAQLVLGTMLFNGDGVTRDYPRAYALILRSSAADIAKASQVLSQMDQYIPQEDRRAGMLLARQYEADSRRTELPPLELADQAEPRAVASTTASRPVAAKTAAAPAKLRVAAKPAAKIVPATGRWRVQLGAFGDPANARKLWSQVAARFPGRSASYVKAGPVTRLLVGPYPTKSDADRACAPLKACVPSER
ncbi:SPOR domain-containing protein [Sphingomonas aliaeris]|uniref:SPOR domain-containing protein n=1 Tax=Sphingomonas aliaeris TaxID=2759526 RepID=A0A974S546_9SPHN|nr:SPOR domain-containing protein [Sphingomonas aliaeris]QQV78174.1 SPOR domain-containing protein [Sphingomonas aliaeris]